MLARDNWDARLQQSTPTVTVAAFAAQFIQRELVS